VAVAARAIGRLRAEGAPYTRALARQLDGLVAMQRGDDARARVELDAAEQALVAVEMRLHAACVRWRRARLVGGDEGARLRADAEAYFRSQGFVRIEPMVATLAPSSR
jgi:hypothetical protein